MNISDTMIHINESLTIEQRSTLEDQLRDIEGVVAPRFSADKARSAGYTAQLVGA